MKRPHMTIWAAAVAVLCVATPARLWAGTAVWNGNTGNGSLSDGGNWADGNAPADGDELDFSALADATTLDADFGEDCAFGAVTMGAGIITFTGSFTAASFSDYSKIAVGENATVTIDNSLSFGGAAPVLCSTVGAGGKLRITGSLTIAHSSGYFKFAANAAAGAVVVEGGIVVNTTNWVTMNAKSLVLGPSGLSFKKSSYVHFTNHSVVYALGEATVLGTEGMGTYSASNPLTICTTQFGSDQPATITFAGFLHGKRGYWSSATVTGCGRAVFTSASKSDRALTAGDDGTTLALVPGADTSGATDQKFTVKSGATLEVAEAGAVAIGGLALFEAGSTLNIASCSAGTAALSVAKTLTLPSDGTVDLTLNGGAFTPGVYVILENSGVTAAMGAKFNISTGGETAAWSVVGNRLVLTVGTVPANRWTGAAGDGSMANGNNWAGGSAPAAGGVADFSAVTVSTTINADIGAKLDAVTMGSGVITFTNALTATSFSDLSKLAVGEDSSVTIDNSLSFSGNDAKNLCYTVAESGKLVVTESLAIQTSVDFYFADDSAKADGAIVIEGGITINTGNWTVMNARKLVLGADGVSLSKGRLCLVNAPTVYSLGTRTVIGSGYYQISTGETLTICTTQYESDLPAVITFAGTIGVTGKYYGSATVTGCGRVEFASSAAANRNLTVDDGATLAVSTKSAFSVSASDNTSTVNSGGILEVSESGVFTISSKFALSDGACLAFNFTDNATAPSLAVAAGKAVAIGSMVNVRISAADGVRPKGGTYTLTHGMDFTGKTVSIVDKPGWVQSVDVDDSGNLTATLKARGLVISFH